MMKEIIEKINDGDLLDDNELRLAILHYTKLVELLLPHGAKYGLVYRDAKLRLYELQGYKEARARNH